MTDCIFPSHISWPNLSPVLTGNSPSIEQCLPFQQQASRRVWKPWLSAMPETVTPPKLAEHEFQKPAWLVSRAAFWLLIGLVLMRTDVQGWPVDGWRAWAESRAGKACTSLRGGTGGLSHAKDFHSRVFPPQPRGQTSWGQLRRPLLDEMKM